jgi:two-component system LytT family response regulator
MADAIRVVIVDDEKKSILTLSKLLNVYCPHVKVIGTAQTVSESIETINFLKPDLVFLDISLPDGDGFDILENVDHRSFEVIFITASDKFAIKAFEFSAIHYLLKPINFKELQHAVERFEQIKGDNLLNEKISILKESLNKNYKKIILPSFEGLIMKDIDDIIRCEADSNYTIFLFTNKEKLLVSKSLNNFEKILADINFCRIHNKHLVNLKYVTKYIKGKAGYVIMQDGSQKIS